MSPGLRHVIVDRDGVLNCETPTPVRTPDEWTWERGAIEALAHLARHGVAVSVATNQSAIGRGTATRAEVDAVHRWLAAELRSMGLRVVGVFMCPHAPEAKCDCRKPRPGLVDEALAAGGFAPSETVFIGDDLRDLEAGRTAGTAVALVRTGKGVATEAALGGTAVGPVEVFDDLGAAALALWPDQVSLR